MSQQNNVENVISEMAQTFATDSIVMDLENLNTQYSNLLIEYEQAVANYTALIQQQDTSGSITSLMNISNNAFWGSGSLSSSTVSSTTQCSASCLNTTGCTGATYNQDTQVCSLRSGEGSLVPAASNSIALIPQETYLLLNMQSINNQLIQINTQIMTATNAGEPEFNTQYSERQVKADELLQNYIMLNKEREKINEMIKSFEDLNQEEVDGNITINKNYTSFILLLILAIAFICVIYILSGQKPSNYTTTNTIFPVETNTTPMFQQGGKLGISTFVIIFVIILVCLVIKYFSNIYSFIKNSVNLFST